eukprot:CAMPEP_0117659528 /NCGR_PEP_ID=MMETSP0804-20121206/6482_1 /TAXON_ID=1074897 /ORGANISM="Tetraselmis astigmatica, Strain CCMP880" /LENGTH=176 /DNA_ID=CAMNT_0005466195 /DNA_START=217 /DNA_END=747 /DNA_ORIENTATION=-
MAAPLKICVVGPSKTGKTFLSKVLAEQSLPDDPEYNPTAGVRIQELTRQVKNERWKVQLWDCAGGVHNQSHWPVLAKGLDGVLMVFDPSQPQHESELEKLYTAFAQPARLTTSQCMTLALNLSSGIGGGPGLQGKLQKLQNASLDLTQDNISAAQSDGLQALDVLLEGCVNRRKAK